jgi:hypothetical protein
MKSRLALLAAPFIALACSDTERATLLDPPNISADVVIQDQPETGNIDFLELKYSAGIGQPCNGAGFEGADQATWHIAEGGLPCSLTVFRKDTSGDPAEGGVFTFYYCDVKGGGQGPQSLLDCQSRVGEWKISPGNRNVPVDADGEATANPSPYRVFGEQGIQVKYTGRGSGLTNLTDVINIIGDQ